MKKQPKSLESRQQVRDREAVRITLIHCLDMLKTLRGKLPNAIPEAADPHGIQKNWLGTAERHLEMLIQSVVENEA